MEIRITDDYIIEMTKDATFKDLSDFAKLSPDNDSFVEEPFIYDIGDSASFDIMQDFIKLYDGRSNKTIYDFFIEYDLYSDSTDLQTYLHIRFID